VRRKLCLKDLFYLLVFELKRQDLNKDWLYDRCNEVQAEPDGQLDLWAREHYKSTIITFGKTVQDILADPEITIGIFSHVRPVAKDFLRQIKREFERNEDLKWLFADVLWANPQREAPKWSEDDGIIVRRAGNPKEATVEAWGVVDGQPTGKHFRLMVYDDLVTKESVTTPDMIRKVTDSWSLSLNLGAAGGAVRMIGTFYHLADTYKEIIRRGSARPRKHPATVDGTAEGEPVLLTREALAKKRADMGPYVFGCQMLLNPIADKAQGFREEWLNFYDQRPGFTQGMNLYLLCDPAGEKKKYNDYTVMVVIGLGRDGNTYLVDGLRDRLNLAERVRAYIAMHRKWSPKRAAYEKYGKDSDIEAIEAEMERQSYRFKIIPVGGPMPKPDRIRRLIPDFENGRFWLPHRLMYMDAEGKARDFVREFVDEEYHNFPLASHDDMFDCIARIKETELGAVFPKAVEVGAYGATETYNPLGFGGPPPSGGGRYDPFTFGM
jgi:predicted phage terminase large subunit-like protein